MVQRNVRALEPRGETHYMSHVGTGKWKKRREKGHLIPLTGKKIPIQKGTTLLGGAFSGLRPRRTVTAQRSVVPTRCSRMGNDTWRRRGAPETYNPRGTDRTALLGVGGRKRENTNKSWGGHARPGLLRGLRLEMKPKEKSRQKGKKALTFMKSIYIEEIGKRRGVCT